VTFIIAVFLGYQYPGHGRRLKGAVGVAARSLRDP
jgi:hypothetical protein